MYKYGGLLIHQSRDEHGILEVVDNGYQYSLHFGTEPRQSSMDRNDPYYLTLSYTRAMLAALLFQHTPRRILLIGLGGGSLAKFLWQHYPGCHIDAVELRPAVHDIARSFFRLPQDARLQVHLADARNFLQCADGTYSDYDLILLDAFTADGVAQDTAGLMFFAACRERLSGSGVLAANLWAEDLLKLENILADLSDTFDRRLLRLPVDGKGNVIALAVQHDKPRQVLLQLEDTAKALQKNLGIEMISFLKQLRKHNRYWGFF